MTAGEKKSSDLSQRLKRPLKSSSRTSKSTASSTISAPPKAAIASGKEKDDGQRRKNPFNEMLHHKSNVDKSSTGPSTPDETLQGNNNNHSSESFQSLQYAGNIPDRIGELDFELEMTSEDQNALREELGKTKHHGQIHSDHNLEDYRRQHQTLYTHSGPRPTSPPPNPSQMDYELETSPRRSFNRTRDDVMEQNFELRNKISELHSQLIEQDAFFKSKLDQRTHARESEWNDLTNRLHNTEKESQERLQQLLNLKHSISALTRMDTQVTDSELAERADALYHRIREFVISNFRRAKLDLENLPVEVARSFQDIHPSYAKIGASDRLSFYQAIIANALMHIFNETVCIGLPSIGPLSSMRTLASQICDTGNAYREWRRTTIRALQKSEARHALKQEEDTLLHRLAANITHLLTSVTRTELTASARATLLAILHSAAELQSILLMQKASYKLHFFRNLEYDDIPFSEERMESVNDVGYGMDEDEDEDEEDKRFAFCVFPCLEKFGDEFGERVEVRNVLLRARVCLGVG